MSDENCTGCEVGRRSFLRDAAMAAAALMAISSTAEGMPLRLISALESSMAESKYAIPATDGVTVDKDKEVILARAAGKIYAFALSCPHQNTALKWLPGDNRFQCPKHKSKYAPDGKYIEGRATRSMDRYQVRKEGASIVVNLDKLYEEDSDKAEWPTAFVTA
jgi:nitrite reductase/ring-hydroxylating ferredoxin subunit